MDVFEVGRTNLQVAVDLFNKSIVDQRESEPPSLTAQGGGTDFGVDRDNDIEPAIMISRLIAA
jgi:hypothetical protein